jgi:hypothetical protein
MNIIGLISGIALVIIGIVLYTIGFFQSSRVGLIVLLIYGSIALIVGILILLNLNKEDKIEQIKRRRR